jgi:hypothetical protein
LKLARDRAGSVCIGVLMLFISIDDHSVLCAHISFDIV